MKKDTTYCSNSIAMNAAKPYLHCKKNRSCYLKEKKLCSWICVGLPERAPEHH